MQKSRPRRVLVTGNPGSGKSTLVLNACVQLRGRGVRLGGFLTSEVREGGKRIGFKIEDLLSGEMGWLAKAQEGSGPVYGRYCVIVEDLERVGGASLQSAIRENVDLIIIDEIAPMEMASRRVGAQIERLLESPPKPVLATFKQGSTYQFLDRVLQTPGTVKLQLNVENRDKLLSRLLQILDESLNPQPEETP